MVDNNICSICYGDIEMEQRLICNHIFCDNCINIWFQRQQQQHNTTSCPLCRETTQMLSNNNYKHKYPDSSFKNNFNNEMKNLFVPEPPINILSQEYPSHSELNIITNNYKNTYGENNYLTKINVCDIKNYSKQKVFILTNDRTKWLIGNIVDEYSDSFILSQCRHIDRLSGETYLLNPQIRLIKFNDIQSIYL